MLQLKARYKRIAKLARFSSYAIRSYGFRFFVITAYLELKKYGLAVFSPEKKVVEPIVGNEYLYARWLNEYKITSEVRDAMKKKIKMFSLNSTLTVSISVDEKNYKYLKETILSISKQIYEDWQIILVRPTSIAKQVNFILNEIKDVQPEIVQTGSLKEISKNSSDFVVFLNSGSIITDDSFFRIIEVVNNNSNVEIIYSDEDEIKNGERINPFFKPDWSPYLFLNFDYISNFCCIKKDLLSQILDSSGMHKVNHYDLLLQLTEKSKNIFHIPTILVSIRKDSKQINSEETSIALSKALKRRKINGTVARGTLPNTFRILYHLDNEPKVSIIIPTRDNKDLLQRCISYIRKNTRYKNYEAIIIDNNSTKKETLDYLRSLPHTVIKYEGQFNFSKINNLAAKHATGEYLLFLNDDAAPLQPNWLSEMVSICQQDDVGAVGAKLVHGDGTIQHAGIAILPTGAGFHPMQRMDSSSAGYFGFLNVIRDCSAVTGACLLIKREIFEAVGGFDDNYDLYYGDSDLCLSVRKLGYSVVYTPYAVLLHQGSSTIKEYATAFFTVENHRYFIKKWPQLKFGDPFYNPNLGWNYTINVESRLKIQELPRDENLSKNELVKKYTTFLESVYSNVLLRSVDASGLMAFLPKLINNELSEETVLSIISESEEAKSIRNFSHYSDKYWNDLQVVKEYLNKLSTGNEKITWIDDLKVRFKQYLPFQKVLIVGCGNGWLERQLYDLGIGIEFDAFDVSEKYLDTAKKEKGDRRINYFVSDINNMENIKDAKYDAVFNFAILHHTTKVEYAIKKLSHTLKDGGLMFNWEYVGSPRNQYTNEHVKIMEEVMSKMPERFRSKHRLRPHIENFRVEPTEAIHSDLIIPMFRKYFDVIHERELNGGVAYQILWNNIDQFRDKSDKEAQKVLKMLLEEDQRLSKEKKVPILFWYSVGKSKQTER